MPTTFDEVLLDVQYSAIAEGGPEFATAIVRSGQGGSIASRAVTREDYISRFELHYGELSTARRKALRQFAILRQGMAKGFRFLPPDDNELLAENAGWLNPATGEVEWLAQTPAANTLTTFYLLKLYSDQAFTQARRIVKPSPFKDVTIDWWDIAANPDTLIGTTTIPANSSLLPFGVINPIVPFTIFTPGGVNFDFYFNEGKIVSTGGPLQSNTILRVTCEYHLPVAFTEDWIKMRVDETNISEFKPGVEELLPIEINLI